MTVRTRVGLLAGAATLTLAGVTSARPATDATNDGLAQRLAAAEAKLAAVEAAQNKEWLTEQRAAEIRGLVQDVLADADTRASLLQGAATAGYDNGFVLSTGDGNWLLRTNFLMQQRFIYNNREAADTNRWGFENTRSKFILSGHVVNPDWFYRVDINVAGNGNAREGTLNAYLGHDYGNGLKVMLGSMKLPFQREELVESQYQLAVERSLLNYVFGAEFAGGYADGIAVQWASDNVRVTGMLSDGANTGQTSWLMEDTEFAITGRGEILLGGNWDQFRDFTNARDGETGIMVGGAVHWEKDEFGTGSAEDERWAITGDVSFETGAFNAFGALMYGDSDSSSSNPLGIVVQGGFYLSDEFEIFGRLEWADLDTPGLEDVTLITFGLNKYFHGHNAKWTTDFGFSTEEVQIPTLGLTGWRNDAAGDDGQWVIRTQFQLLF